MPESDRTEEQERLWKRANEQAAKQGRGGDFAFVTGIYKRISGHDSGQEVKKSIGSTIPTEFRLAKIPGQLPNRRITKELQALTAMPSRRMNLIESTHPCFTAERVVEGLPLPQDWAGYIAKAMSAPNELVMRQNIMSKMHEERMGADLRRVLFARSMSLWRERERMAKSVNVVTVENLKKAGPYIGPRGGKWKDPQHKIPWKVSKKKETIFEPPEEKRPNKDMVEAYRLGKLAHERHGGDLTAIMYDDDVVEPDYGKVGNEVYDLFWEAGRQEKSMPQWVRGWRFGKVPEGGRSKNYREQIMEPGVSLMGLLESGKLKNQATGGLAGITVSGRPSYLVDGWLHFDTGSDDEPLLVGAKAVRKLTAKEARAGFENRSLTKGERFVLIKGGPYIGPRGGKWKDPQHKIPWEGEKPAKTSKTDLARKMVRIRELMNEEYPHLSDTEAQDLGRKLSDAQAGRPGADMDAAIAAAEAALSVAGKEKFTHPKKVKLSDGKVAKLEAGGERFGDYRIYDKGRFVGRAGWSAIKRRLAQGELFKADPRGGTYIKRVPKPGGGYRYFYDEDKYKNHDGAHVSGSEAAEIAVAKAVAGHIKNAGKDGCDLATLKPLAKRYGADMVGGMLNNACAGGSLVYKNKRLFKRGSTKPNQTEPKRTKPESTKKSGYFFTEPFEKAGPYIGPRGGKWADPQHKIPWDPEKHAPKQFGLFDQPVKPEPVKLSPKEHVALKVAASETGVSAGGRLASWPVVNELRDKGLIQKSPSGSYYVATDKGKQVLQTITKPKPEKKGLAAFSHNVHGNFRRGDLVTDVKGDVYKIKTGGVAYHEDDPERLYGAEKAKAPKAWEATQQIRTTIDKILREGTPGPGSRGAYRKTPDGEWVNRGQEMPQVAETHKWRDAQPGSLATFPSITIHEGGYVRAVKPVYDDAPVIAWVRDQKLATTLAAAMKEAPQPMHIPRAEVLARKSAAPLQKSQSLVPDEPFEDEQIHKAVGHKYIRRVLKPGGGYRYYYRESAAAREAKAGEEIRLGKRMARVVSVAKDGTITLELDGKRQIVKPKQWHDLLTRHYGRAFVKGAQRRAQQAINAVMRHVPRALLQDLKGATDEERLADLEKRVPAVYAKLKAAFQRAGMDPFAAKRSLSLILERRGWNPEARALVIGTVIRHRKIGTRNLISASENLAGGRPVHEGHVAAVVELRMPGGNPEAFPAKTAEVAQSAEAELAKLAKRLSEAKVDDESSAREAAGAVLAEVMSSEAMQKLQLLAKAFPGLVDRAIEPTRRAMLAAGSVAPRKEPTTEGGETIVYVAGEGGKPKALEARYRLVEADTLIASHDPESFARHKDYPEGVQERAYHRDKAEQAKVIRNAQKMDPRFVVNTNPDAVNGPPMVTEEGIVLGGNSRAMSMQRIYKMHPEKATQMREYLETHAHEAGLKPQDIQAMKNPVLIREVKIEDKSKAGMQLLVRQMNETFTQGMDPRTMQVAMGRRLTDRTLQTLADSMAEDETLAAFLASSRSERFVGALFQAGVIDTRNVNQYTKKGTRTLNNDGRMLVSRILVGRTVDDADVLSDTGVQMMDSIAGSVPAMVQATAHGKGFDLGEDLGVAVDAFNDLQRLAEQGTIRALDPKMTDRDINQMYNYFDVLPGIGESHPVVRNERAQILLEVLIRKRGPVQMAKVFREYARIAAANPEQQAAMFGAKTSPIDALKQAAGVEKKEPQLRLVASMPSERIFPLVPKRFVILRSVL